MQTGRFGTLAGFSAQVVGAGVNVVFPNDKWIGWFLIAIGSATMLVSVPQWIYANRVQIWRGLRKVEPHHLIWVGFIGTALCAALALTGLIWQSYRQVPTANSSTIAAPAVTVPVIPAIPEVRTAPIDIPIKVKIIDDYLSILRNDMVSFVTKGMQLSTWGWWNYAVQGQEEKLHAEIREWNESYRDLNNKIQNLNRDIDRFPDILSITKQSYLQTFSPIMMRFMQVVGGFGDQAHNIPREGYRAIVEPVAGDMYRQMQLLEDWRNGTIKRALEIRLGLSR